jgi:hypothetical protein
MRRLRLFSYDDVDYARLARGKGARAFYKLILRHTKTTISLPALPFELSLFGLNIATGWQRCGCPVRSIASTRIGPTPAAFFAITRFAGTKNGGRSNALSCRQWTSRSRLASEPLRLPLPQAVFSIGSKGCPPSPGRWITTAGFSIADDRRDRNDASHAGYQARCWL